MKEKNREMVMEALANYYNIEPDEDGEYDINSYDWQSGCSFHGSDRWLTLSDIVYCMEDFIEDELIYELEDLMDEE